MLIIGASHVARLEAFCTKKSTPERFVKPFEESHYISVGGTTWEDCLQHFRGEELSDRQEAKKLGNQWLSFYQTKKKPVFTVIMLGSNSIDRFDREIRDLELRTNKRENFWRRALKKYNAAYNRLYPAVYKVVDTIKKQVPYSRLMYLKVIPRAYWHTLSRRLSRRLDCYINMTLRRKFNITEIRVQEVMLDKHEIKSEVVLPGMICTDEVHLNSYGNRALSKAITRSIAHKWLNMKKNQASKGFVSAKKRKSWSKKKAKKQTKVEQSNLSCSKP